MLGAQLKRTFWMESVFHIYRYADGHKEYVYFYKLLVFLHILFFAFIFILCFIICGTLRNCKHAFFFLSFGLLWAILFDRTHNHSIPLYPHSLLFFSWYCYYSPSPSLVAISRCVSVYKLNEASDVSQSTATFEIILKNATMLPNSTSSHSLSLSLSMFLSLSLVFLFIYISSCSVRIFSLFWPDTLWGRNLLKLSKFNEISLVARHKMRYIF